MRIAMPMDTQNYETRLTELRRLQGEANYRHVKWCIELITHSDRDFGSRRKRNHLRATCDYLVHVLTADGITISHCDLFYWYDRTENSEELNRHWDDFEAAVQAARTMADCVSGQGKPSVTFHHHGVRWFRDYPHWRRWEVAQDDGGIPGAIVGHYRSARQAAEYDIQRMLKHARGSDVHLNIEITTPGDFSHEGKWEILYFAPVQLSLLLDHFRDPRLGLVLDVSHLALGAQCVLNEFPNVHRVILEDASNGYGGRSGHGGMDLNEPLSALKERVKLIHVNDCTGASVERDHGKPVRPCGPHVRTKVKWEDFLKQTRAVFNPQELENIVWIPEIQNSDQDSGGVVHRYVRDCLAFIAGYVGSQVGSPSYKRAIC